jgi:hypothetical protein
LRATLEKLQTRTELETNGAVSFEQTLLAAIGYLCYDATVGVRDKVVGRDGRRRDFFEWHRGQSLQQCLCLFGVTTSLVDALEQPVEEVDETRALQVANTTMLVDVVDVAATAADRDTE